MPISRPSARSSGTSSRLEQRDLEAAVAARGRHLGADEAGADHDHPLGQVVEVGAQGEAVVERAQHVHALEHRCPGQPAGRGAGGDDEAVVADPVAAVEAHEAIGQVEAHGPTPEQVLEVEVLARPPAA